VAVAAPERQEVRAQAKWVRASARKSRLVLDLIRGRSVPEARTLLAFSQRAVARDIERVLRSAVANAEANHGLDGDELVVVAAYADEGPTLKRGRPRARGRYARIFKRTCHITVKVAELDGAKRAPAKRAAAKAEAAPPTDETAKPKRARTAPKRERGATPAPKSAQTTTPKAPTRRKAGGS
jgi:large subunit ribosomal protein L22